MPHDSANTGREDAGTIPPAQAPLRPRGLIRRNWLRLTLAALVLVPSALFALWASIALAFSYSSGERVGFVQKLSRKGWVCKTWEGELQMVTIPGTAPAIFHFSVRSDSVARAIQGAAGKQVALQYDEHRGVPTACFGETDYYVVGVRTLGTS